MDSKIVFLNKILTYIFIVSVLSVLGSNFYNYVVTKRYSFLVEASCNPSLEKCFYRDCDIKDECPPNKLSYYKKFIIKSKEFPFCVNNSCKNECESNFLICTEVVCGGALGDTCVLNN